MDKNFSNKKIAYKNLGCKVNLYELEKIKNDFYKNGFLEVGFNEVADIYIVNTCSVTSVADKKSRQMLHRPKKTNKNAIVVAIGCTVDSSKDELSDINNHIDLLITNEEKNKIYNIVIEYLKKLENKKECRGEFKKCRGDIYEPFLKERDCKNNNTEKKYFDIERVRTTIKIEDGCNQFCSYCIIPYLRGRVKSREINDVVSEIKDRVEKGTVEVILTGIHISSYYLDYFNKSYESEDGRDLVREKLIELMKEIAEIEKIKRIRLGSLEPRIINKEFLENIKSNKNLYEKFCPTFHLSLQSGSDNILKKMNRKYDIKGFKAVVDIIRSKFIDSTITTDIIVGFPTETDEDFFDSLNFAKSIRFYNPNIFKYSVRKGTKAEKMEQVLNSVKDKRSDLMIKELEKITNEYNEKKIGKTVEILVEEIENYNDNFYYLVGYTKDYYRVKVFCNKSNFYIKIGNLINCTINEIKNNYLLAKN